MALPALTPGLAAQRTDGAYIGTLGSSVIVVRFDTGGTSLGSGARADVYADYHKRAGGKDVRWVGSRQGDTWTLTGLRVARAGPLVTSPDRSWTLDRIIQQNTRPSSLRVTLRFASGTVTGTWTDLEIKGSSLPIRLRRATQKDLNALKLGGVQTNAWVNANPYAALRFDAGFKLASTQTVDGKRVKWLVEPKSGVRLPRLPGERAEVNDLLQLEHLKAADAILACSTKAHQYDTTLGVYTGQLFSMGAKVDGLCNRPPAFMDVGNENITIDLKHARKLELSDLYRFTNLPVARDPLSTEFVEYQNAVWVTLEHVLRTQNRTLPEGIDASCLNAYPANNPFKLRKLAWFLTPTGLAIHSRLRGAPCENNFTLPYARLRSYLAPNSPLR
jgi:hypothetical protein